MVTHYGTDNFNINLRSILSLAAGIASILIVFIFTTNYAFFKFYKITNDYRSKMQAYETLAYDTNVSYITFKTQVQEWKNILLRGFNTEDYNKYYSAFIEKREDVQSQLENLQKNADQIGVDPTQILFLKTQHKELIDLTDALLSSTNLQDIVSIHATDKQIRGKDRPLGDTFEKFSREIKIISDQSKKDLIQKMEETIHSLKNVLWGIIVIAFIILFFMTVLILKSERTR